MRKLWRDAGLEAIEIRLIDIEVTFADFDDFWKSNTGLGGPTTATLRPLPAADLE
jgi:hypothetical protein